MHGSSSVDGARPAGPLVKVVVGLLASVDAVSSDIFNYGDPVVRVNKLLADLECHVPDSL